MKNHAVTTRGAFLLISLLIGVVLLWNFVDYEPTLSAGDHGLVLYAAQATLRGEVPFRDYHYFYGPLMPYYYGGMLQIFGDTLSSVLIGELFLRLACGLLVYCILSLFLHPLLSMAGGVWFWTFNKEFFYTFNHVGINVCSLSVLLLILCYLKQDNLKYLYGALFTCFIAGLIKLNFGFSLLFTLFLSVLFIKFVQKRKLPWRFCLWAILITPLTILLSNFLFVAGLPFYIIRQCYQYFGTDAVAAYYPKMTTAIASLFTVAYKEMIKSWYTESIFTIIAIIGIANIYQLKKNGIKHVDLKPFLVLLGLCIFMYVTSMHEYLVSGVFFRSYYSYPILIVTVFLTIGFFARRIPSFVHHTLCLIILFLALTQFWVQEREIQRFRTQLFFLPMAKAKIFVGNRPPWAQTVTQATIFLQEHLKEGELFCALPCEPLYYYLLNRKSPTRQLVIFDFLQIPTRQEESIIGDLEAHHVNWVLISNRAITNEVGLGVLGRDYCPLIAKYLNDNFEIAKQFGEWTPAPSWARRHGVRILKRKGR